MQIFSGQSISSDVVFGPLHFLTPAPPTISAHSPLPPEEEWERFSTAHRQAVLELAQLYEGYEPSDRGEALEQLRKTTRNMGDGIDRAIQPRQQERSRRHLGAR